MITPKMLKHLVTPWQSVGAKGGLNVTLASKLMLRDLLSTYRLLSLSSKLMTSTCQRTWVQPSRLSLTCPWLRLNVLSWKPLLKALTVWSFTKHSSTWWSPVMLSFSWAKTVLRCILSTGTLRRDGDGAHWDCYQRNRLKKNWQNICTVLTKKLNLILSQQVEVWWIR